MKHEKIGLNEVATEFTLNLVYALAEKYNTSLKKVLDYFDSIHYWKILNDDGVCGVLAHDGVKAAVNNLGGNFNDFISWDGQLS